MNLRQQLNPRQVNDPRANFASVYDLTSVTVYMSFSFPEGTSRGGLRVLQHWVTRLAELTFLHRNRTPKLHRVKSNFVYAQC